MPSLLNRYKGLPKEIYILFLARMISSMGAFVYPLLTLIMTYKIGLSTQNAGLIMTVLLLTQIPAFIIGGKIADKYGRKKLLILFQLLGALTYIICGFMQASMLSVYLIVLASNFYALTYPAMDAITTDLTNPGNRKEGFSLLYMGLNLGFAIGPMLGGFLYKNSLSLIFIGDAATTVISTVLLCIFIKETLPQRDKQASEQKSDDPERYQEGSLLQVIMRRKFILLFAFVFLLYEFAYSQWAFALPLHMQSLFIDSARDYGILASFNGLLVIVLTPLITWLIQNWRTLYGTALAGVLFSFSFFILIFAKELVFFFFSVFLLTVGEIFSAIDSRTFLANHAPSSHRARLNSLINMISGIGKALSPLVIGQMIAGNGMIAGWILLSLIAFIGAALLFCAIKVKAMKGNAKEITDIRKD